MSRRHPVCFFFHPHRSVVVLRLGVLELLLARKKAAPARRRLSLRTTRGHHLSPLEQRTNERTNERTRKRKKKKKKSPQKRGRKKWRQKRLKMKTFFLLLLLLLRINNVYRKKERSKREACERVIFTRLLLLLSSTTYLLNVRHKRTKNIIHNVVSHELYLQEFSL